MSKTITHLLTEDIIIKRLRVTSGRIRAFSSTATIDGMVQLLDRNKAARLGIIEEQSHIAWFDVNEDVQEGDHVVDQQGREFYVKIVTKKDYGINTHLEVILEKPNE